MNINTTPVSSALIQRSRSVERIVRGQATSDGDGVKLTRVLTQALQRRLDPFLMLDAFGSDDAADYIGGFPDHPHRGFETVTYMLAGRMRHFDNHGHEGVIEAGDVQWMTAGRGVIHSEMPEQQSGLMRGFQLWINLPRKDKMIPPRYQDTASARIPEVANADGSVRVKVIAGEAMGTRGVIETRIPVLYLHLMLKPGAEFATQVPKSENAFVYVVEGAARFGSTRAEASQVALLDRGGEAVSVVNPGTDTLSALLIAGEPIGEPVARYGPFVMNSKEEVWRAVEDYREGKMGTL